MGTPASFKKNDPRINREGAPKKAWTITGLIKESLEETNEDGIPYKKILVDKLRTIAVRGDITAIKEMNNRLDGMPKQSTDITTGGESLKIIFGSEKNGSDITDK